VTQDPPNIEVDEQVIEQLTSIADTMTDMVGRMMDTHEVQSSDMKHFKEEISHVREALQRVVKVLMEGNGERPLIARVATLEAQMLNAIDDVDTLQKREERRLINEVEEQKIDKKGKYAIRAAVISGFIALATSVISLLAG